MIADTTLRSLEASVLSIIYNRLQRTYRYQNQVQHAHLEDSHNPDDKDYKSMPPTLAIEAMQHEITYLRQEVEFLKKIVSVMNKKREDLS